MPRSLKDLERYRVCATDGDIGSVEDYLPDDQRWDVRYPVIDTSHWDDSERPVYWAEGAHPEEAELAHHAGSPRRSSS